MQLRHRPELTRCRDGRLIGGVAAGLADHLDVDRRWVRAAFAVGGVFGLGILVYLSAWGLMPNGEGGEIPVARFAPRGSNDSIAIVVIAFAAISVIAQVGFSIPLRLVVPIAVAGIALAVVLSWPGSAVPIATAQLPRWLPPAAAEVIGVLGTRRGLLLRTLIGAVLVAVGTTALLASSSSWSRLRDGVVALLVVLAGIAFVFGPWLSRLGGELVEERRARIRTQERAEMAAHLHDSVLQTLAMVQRRAEDPSEVVRLARRQERELRDWLLSGQPGTILVDDDVLSAALRRLAAVLESEHGVPVDVVQVGDTAITTFVATLLLAVREAIVNAQQHSGAAVVAVFCEVQADSISVFVRDRGNGFDRAGVADDRRGIAESIEGRMARAGGSAVVHSGRGEGTEVRLVMPTTP